jgi:hypothetical protein
MAPRTIRGLAGYCLALLVVVGCWAVGVPRFGSPDETAHVYKAYGTAHGELLGTVAPGFPDNLREFDGPDSLGPPNLNCYVGQPDVPASCATEISPLLISSAARYPPWYYELVGVPAAVTGQGDSVLAYRLISAALCIALLAWAMLMGKRSQRSDLAALQLAALTPMALFLMASVNPNAIEIAAFVAIWACLTRVTTDERLPRRLLIAASWLAAAVVLMRPISIVWLVGLAVVVLVGTRPPRRRELFTWRSVAWMVGPTALALVGSWLWIAYSSFEISDDRTDRSLTLATAIRRSIELWPGFMRQTIGVLGWLDTLLPSFVYYLWGFALLIVVVIHLRGATGRGVAALAMLVAVWLALPLVINGFTNSRAGLTYQGRYSLPIFVGLVFLPTWCDRSTLRLPRIPQRWLVAAVLALVVVAEVGAFWQMLRRFTVGAHGKVLLTGDLSWEPSVAPMLLVAINAVAMIGLSWSAWRPWGEIEAAPGERNGEGTEHGAD